MGEAQVSPTHTLAAMDDPREERPDLSELEQTALDVAAEWGVTVGETFELGRYSFVAAAGDDAVLKVTPEADYDADHEADALAYWGGNGAVALRRSEPSRRAILEERARPGTDLSGLDDDEATGILVEVGKRLWSAPAAPPLRPVRGMLDRWLAEADEGAPLVPLARRLLGELDWRDDAVVHGDFHHYNVLRHGDGYVAIDPKPYAGEAEFDVPTVLWNPIDMRTGTGSLPHERTLRRLAAFEAAGLDPWRMRVWLVVRGAYLGADTEEQRVIRSLL